MKCPSCGNGKASIINTRHEQNYIYRRRVCDKCGLRFSTYEVLDDYWVALKAINKIIASKENVR